MKLHIAGPSPDLGPLPSIFYFALSGHDSLFLDPFNQPVQFLKDRPIRFFSLDLPAHGNPNTALATWAKDITILFHFFDEAQKAIQSAIDQNLADPHKLAIAGLSRGGFIASHLAARDPRFKYILQFAPLTDLAKSKDLYTVDEPRLSVYSLVPQLADRHIRFYIGNKDTRVDTRSCFEFAMQLTAASKHRSPQIELILSPSIGQMGHGTPPEVFRAGAEWLYMNLTSLNSLF